jgi:predicted HTH transcriptional regulator
LITSAADLAGCVLVYGQWLPLARALQNSVRNSISPAANIRLHSVQVIGSAVIIIFVPPWNKKDVYQFDEKILIHKGTNVFAAKPEEVRKLHSGRYVI